MPRHKVLDLMRTLDPVDDHQQIVCLMTAYEFPFDITRALEFALYRTFAVPSISALLDQTGEFTRHAQKRYDDTDLILSTIYEYGYDSEQGRAALRRMKRLHGRFAIANDDYLYVLSTLWYDLKRYSERGRTRRCWSNWPCSHPKACGGTLLVWALSRSWADLCQPGGRCGPAADPSPCEGGNACWR